MNELIPGSTGEALFTEPNINQAVPLGDLAVTSFDQANGAPATTNLITEGGCCSSSNNNCN